MSQADSPIVEVGWKGAGKAPPGTIEVLTATAAKLLLAMAGRAELAGRGAPLELSVLLVDDSSIRPMNLRWRGVDAATDVLSFPMDEGPLLGDVVISVETAANRLRPGDWSLDDELLFLLIHGLLHLLGHDHEQPGERALMEQAEQQLWTAMGRTGTLRTPK